MSEPDIQCSDTPQINSRRVINSWQASFHLSPFRERALKLPMLMRDRSLQPGRSDPRIEECRLMPRLEKRGRSACVTAETAPPADAKKFGTKLPPPSCAWRDLPFLVVGRAVGEWRRCSSDVPGKGHVGWAHLACRGGAANGGPLTGSCHCCDCLRRWGEV